jgi:hypothetical protein
MNDVVCEANAMANKALCGFKVRILSNYNGQPYGRSRKSLKGSIQIIDSVRLSGQDLAHSYASLRGHSLCIGLDEIELLEQGS